MYRAREVDASGRVIRKEIRTMSVQERNQYFTAMQKLYNSVLPGAKENQYHTLVYAHTGAQSPSAHFGTAFASFHRVLITK